MKIDHIALVIKDLPKAKAFFLDLGFIVKKEGPIQGKWVDILTGLENVQAEYVALGFPDRETNLELLTFTNPEIIPDEHIGKSQHIGFRHLAFAVDNIAETVARLQAKGITFLSDIQEYQGTKRLCYFYGPEGILLEIAEYK